MTYADDWHTHTLEAASDPLALLEREWLLTNGTGAYAMGTAVGCPTRRYHGLLVAATRPPVARVVTLNQMWEQLILRHSQSAAAPQTLDFTSLMFRAGERRVFSPMGHQGLQRFQRGLSVRWVYAWGKIEFERELLLHWKHQAATLRYRIRGLEETAAAATLRLSPMLTLRDFHSVLLRASSGPFRFDLRDQNLVVRHNATVVTLVCPGARFAPNDHWWYGVHYPLELERGQEDAEDYFVPGSFEIDLPATSVQEVTLTVALGEEPATPLSAPHARAAHLKPIADHLAKPPPPAPDSRAPRATSTASPAPDAALARALALASDDFIVGRTLHGQRLATIIAGYPWFADWGRDTFIALPGLLLETGRLDEARAVLRAFAGAIHHGLVPNRFDDYDQQYAHYNTVDASLWFIRAAIAYLHASGDEESWRHWLAQACVHIVESYQAGTGDPQEAQGIELPAAQEPAAQPTKLIRMTEDGLITAGTPQTQLTWMDAAVGAPGSPGRVVFTPRPGKAVEINALWYSALLELAQVLEKAAPPQELPAPANQLAQRYRRLAAKVKRAFVATFWSKQHSHLIDHIYVDELGQEHRDASLRPNQIFAVALPHSPLTQAQQRQVVQAVRQKLLTPAGLRTLSPDDPHYHGRYTGSPYQRDEAYHQGTVWPWLIGPYVEAVLRVGQFSPKARAEAAEAIQPLLDRLVNSPATPAPGQPPSPVPPPSTTTDRPTLPPVGAVGQLHEIHEGDPPHRPVGCIAQAWSVAEVLRAWRLIHRPA